MTGRHLLILGGTGEAAALARALADRGEALRVTSSLAGRTAAGNRISNRRMLRRSGVACFMVSGRPNSILSRFPPTWFPSLTDIPIPCCGRLP